MTWELAAVVLTVLGSGALVARFVFVLEARVDRLVDDLRRLSSETVRRELHDHDVRRIDDEVERKASVEALSALRERLDDIKAVLDEVRQAVIT
jgi:hypothetical protein